MRYQSTLCLIVVLLATTFGLSVLSASSQIGHSPQEKARHKDFGSSLKRLKWDEKKQAAVESRNRSTKNQNSGSDEDVVRVNTMLVVCDVLVVDKRGRSMKGLTPNDFVVTEDGKPQQIGTFALGDNATIPRSIVLILDYSKAQLGFIKSSVEAAKTLVDNLSPNDRMAIVTDEIKLLVGFTQDRARLKETLESLNKKALSRDLHRHRFSRGAHYSALMATLKELFSDEDLRPIIILQALGNEAVLLQQPIGLSVPPNLSRDEQEEALKWVLRQRQYLRPHMREFSLNDIYAAAERSRATIYMVIPGFRLIGLSPDERVKRIKDWEGRIMSEWAEAAPGGSWPQQFHGKNYWELVFDADGVLQEQIAMVELAKLTGGWAEFIEQPTQAAAVYSRIFSDVNNRYVIGYYPSNKEHDGTRREVKIEVRNHPEYSVWGRKSYYAPKPN